MTLSLYANVPSNTHTINDMQAMKEDGLPSYSSVIGDRTRPRRRRWHRRTINRTLCVVFIALLTLWHWQTTRSGTTNPLTSELRTLKLQQDYAQCAKLRHKPQDPSGARSTNARFVKGTKSYLIKNATIWTGEAAPGACAADVHSGKAFTWIAGDVLLENGLITRVATSIDIADVSEDHVIYHADGKPLTAGIVDMHSHAGVDSLPSLPGGEDTNELSENITPFVRSIDGINPLDHQIQVIKSGGVTTSLILPGSGNNMGGEAYVIKLAVGKPDGREEISANDMLADPDHTWRYMKMACGENAKRVTRAKIRAEGPFSRLGEAWYFRHAFEQAADLVRRQDEWCAAADQVGPTNMAEHLPLDLKWESLGAALRGQVMVNTHCYTVPDLESFVGYTNEFNFSVRAFHHAHQTYLVPEILKRAYGDRPPAAALFADNMYYKVESYIASEQAGKILYDEGLTPVYVSDNPVINAQHVLFEAAKAFRYGLPYHAALAGVTSAPADLLGLGNRIGKVVTGFDADIVVWDSDPLSVGAAPAQVWIDGTPQLSHPIELKKPYPSTTVKDSQSISSPSGLPATKEENVIISGISKVLIRGREMSFESADQGRAVIEAGQISCIGVCESEISIASAKGFTKVKLSNGYIVPGFTAFGSHLGLVEIQGEKETQDGSNTAETFSAAVDGLMLQSKNLQAAHAHGVTKAISAPSFQGLSAGFRTGAAHAFEKDAVWEEHAALHYSLTPNAKQGKQPTLSGAVGELRSKLQKAASSKTLEDATSLEAIYLARVVNEEFPLVLTTHSADIIAAILRLKADFEKKENKTLNIAIEGAAESHMVAAEIATADVSVVLAPLLPYAHTWDQRRSLTGAPLTNGTAIDALLAAGVSPSRIAIGVDEDWEARDLDLSAGTAFINSGGQLTEQEAIDLVSTNVLSILGLDKKVRAAGDFVVYEGSPLEITGRIVAVADGQGIVNFAA